MFLKLNVYLVFGYFNGPEVGVDVPSNWSHFDMRARNTCSMVGFRWITWSRFLTMLLSQRRWPLSVALEEACGDIPCKIAGVKTLCHS